MRTLLAALLLVISMPCAGALLDMQCQVISQSDADAPAIIQRFLADRPQSMVRQCTSEDLVIYGEIGEVSRHSNVCLYPDYELEFSTEGELGRLGSPQRYMYVTEGACPPFDTSVYVAASDLPVSVFSDLMEVIQGFATSPERFDAAFRGIWPDEESTRERKALRTMLFGPKPELVVGSIDRKTGFGIWERYDINIADPERFDEFYAVYVDRWFGSYYRVSRVGKGIY